MTPEERKAKKRAYSAAYRAAHKDEKKAYSAAHKDERKAYSAAYYSAHKDEKKAYSAAYHSAHKDEKKAYRAAYYSAHKDERKAYRAAHKDEKKAYSAAYRAAHKDEKKAYSAAYYSAHKDEKKAYQKTPNGKAIWARSKHKRRVNGKGLDNSLTATQWQKIIDLQKNKCADCGKPFTKKRPATRDHIFPLSFGVEGLHSGNVEARCQSCNSKKHAKLDMGKIQTWIALTTPAPYNKYSFVLLDKTDTQTLK